jgi:hypothetical protein
MRESDYPMAGKMKLKKFVPIIIFLGILMIVFVWVDFLYFNDEDGLKVLISTDKTAYQEGETIHIRIENWDDHTIKLYCPMNCALGNFPTSVEQFKDGEWEYLAGFCPSIEPLFGSYDYEGDYIVHSLAPGNSFELEISNLEALHLQDEVTVRIMYYIERGRGALYSAPFIVKP